MFDKELEDLVGVMHLDGYTDREISVELNMKQSQVKYIRHKLGLINKLRIYSDKDLLDKLKELGNITVEELAKIPNAASIDTYTKRFGSWNAAKQLAGIPINAINYTDKELLEILRNSHNKTYEYFQDSANRDKVPSGTTYFNRFGSWAKSLEYAGLPSNSFSLISDKETWVYLVEFNGYYKVGITQQTISNRFTGYPDYTVILTLSCSNLKDAKSIETEWLNNVSKLAYYSPDFPRNNGSTECFKF